MRLGTMICLAVVGAPFAVLSGAAAQTHLPSIGQGNLTGGRNRTTAGQQALQRPSPYLYGALPSPAARVPRAPGLARPSSGLINPFWTRPLFQTAPTGRAGELVLPVLGQPTNGLTDLSLHSLYLPPAQIAAQAEEAEGAEGLEGLPELEGMPGLEGLTGMAAQGYGGIQELAGNPELAGMQALAGYSGMAGAGALTGVSAFAGASGLTGMGGPLATQPPLAAAAPSLLHPYMQPAPMVVPTWIKSAIMPGGLSIVIAPTILGYTENVEPAYYGKAPEPASTAPVFGMLAPQLLALEQVKLDDLNPPNIGPKEVEYASNERVELPGLFRMNNGMMERRVIPWQSNAIRGQLPTTGSGFQLPPAIRSQVNVNLHFGLGIPSFHPNLGTMTQSYLGLSGVYNYLSPDVANGYKGPYYQQPGQPYP